MTKRMSRLVPLLAVVLAVLLAAPADARATRCSHATAHAVHRSGTKACLRVGGRSFVVVTRGGPRPLVVFLVRRGRHFARAGSDRLPAGKLSRVASAGRALVISVRLRSPAGCRSGGTLHVRYRLRRGRWRRASEAADPPVCAAPAPGPTPTPASACPVPRPQTTWRAPRSAPLTDAQAAACVSPSPENRPENTAQNGYLPSGQELAGFQAALDVHGRTPAASNPDDAWVTGRAAAYGIRSTDDILEWAAYKWGIPEDFERAQAAMESWWSQGYRGDRMDGVNASQYPVEARIDSDSAYESLGILQLRWRPGQPWNQGIEPLRWVSTAFNADYSAALIRYYYDGYCDWCGSGYAAGDVDGAYRAYVSGSWTQGQWYANGVRSYAASKPWTAPGF